MGVLPYQSLLDKEAEENGIAHFSEALEHISLQLCILNDVLQLMVEKLQDSLKEKEGQSERDWNHFPVIWCFHHKFQLLNGNKRLASGRTHMQCLILLSVSLGK